MLAKSEQTEIDAVRSLLENETFLRLSVLDVQLYDDTLVVMTDNVVPRTFVRLILRRAWSGPIEVYCATALMTGSKAALS